MKTRSKPTRLVELDGRVALGHREAQGRAWAARERAFEQLASRAACFGCTEQLHHPRSSTRGVVVRADDRADHTPVSHGDAAAVEHRAEFTAQQAGEERLAVLAGDRRRVHVVRWMGGQVGRQQVGRGVGERIQARRLGWPLAQVVRVDVGVASGGSAGLDQRASQRLGPAHPHPAEVGEDVRQCALHRDLELEVVRDHAAVAFLALEARERHAVRVGQQAPPVAVRIGDDRHSSHSRRRARS